MELEGASHGLLAAQNSLKTAPQLVLERTGDNSAEYQLKEFRIVQFGVNFFLIFTCNGVVNLFL